MDKSREESAAFMKVIHLDECCNILIDSDCKTEIGKDKTKTKIEEALKNSGVSFINESIHFVENEIESWYVAGLENDFPFFNPKKKNQE